MSDFYDYAVSWEVDESFPLWQLTALHVLRVDVTKRFDSRFRISAYKDIPETESLGLKDLMARGIIPCSSCGKEGFEGYGTEIFKHVPRPGDGWGWYVTNNILVFPGWRTDFVTRHPKDGYTVQFHNVPWGIFKRYWRRPINLDKQFHSAKTKGRWGKSHGYALGHPAVKVLYFDTTLMLKNYKCIIADFSRMGGLHLHDREINQEIHVWMKKYARQFRVLSDQESPFVKEDAEVCFTMEWM